MCSVYCRHSYGLLGGGGSLPLFLKDLHHLFPLPLGPDVAAQSLFAELEGTLVLRDTQQALPLIGSKASDLLHQVTNKTGVLGGRPISCGGPQRPTSSQAKTCAKIPPRCIATTAVLSPPLLFFLACVFIVFF